MLRSVLYLIFFCPVILLSQSISVDSQAFTDQELIENVLVDSNCITNIQVTNVIGGLFEDGEKSYGYFNANGSGFPLSEGIVLTTGRLDNVPGPNDTLSDDDAQGWVGDADLELVLNEQNTTNATIIEFTFQSTASEVRFRYLFASEEYQEGNPNTCNFSDLFGFLIRPQGEQGYENIALVPDTTTPVKVTTVHPEIPNGCPAINEFYFESFNNSNSPINFNGQTKILEARATIQPNATYEVKLVIADEQNFRFDSAVFLEAGSFQLGTELGPDRTVAGGNPICGQNTTVLAVNEPLATSYSWQKEGVPLSETSNELTVTEDGFYTVQVGLDNGCEAFGEVTIEFAENPSISNTTLQQCDPDGNGLSQFNLFDALDAVTNNDSSLIITDFYVNQNNAQNNVNAINNATSFSNTVPNQTVFARVASQSGCSSIASVQLTTGNANLTVDDLIICDNDEVLDGVTTINLSEVTDQILLQVPSGSTIRYYETAADALAETNQIAGNYENTTPFFQNLFVRINVNGQCLSITDITINILNPPLLEDDEEMIYCTSIFPNTISLQAGVLGNATGYQYIWEYNGDILTQSGPSIAINEVGIYTVTAIAPNGCSASRVITVLASSLASITDVLIEDSSDNNRVEILVEGEGVYEYAIGNILGPYQESPVFENIEPGFYTVFVKDLKGCGFASREISILGFPTYFTPNGDGINDTWKLDGATDIQNRTVRFLIFDRFGKSLYQAKRMGNGWNGVYNGVTLPRNDYWYLVELEDGRIFRGHFSLLR